MPMVCLLAAIPMGYADMPYARLYGTPNGRKEKALASIGHSSDMGGSNKNCSVKQRQS